MTKQRIASEDMTLKRMFQDFYRLPDYQREYVWGEPDPKGEGDEAVAKRQIFLAKLAARVWDVQLTGSNISA